MCQQPLTLLPAPVHRSVGDNDITGEGAEQLAKAVLEHTTLTDFCNIPLASLRSNSVTQLDLAGKEVGEPGAIVLAALLPSATALASLKCEAPHPRPKCQQPLTFLYPSRLQRLNKLHQSRGRQVLRRGAQDEQDALRAQVRRPHPTSRLGKCQQPLTLLSRPRL